MSVSTDSGESSTSNSKKIIGTNCWVLRKYIDMTFSNSNTWTVLIYDDAFL